MIYFIEIQKFRQKWIWILLITMSIIFIYGGIQQLFFGKQFGDKPTPDEVLVITSLMPLAVMLLFYFMRLETEITDEGISYQFIPLHFKKRIIKWETISECYVRSYRPLWEFGGWGIRYSIRNGKAYNVSGKQGLQLVLKNKSKILIGTQKTEELKKIIEELQNKKIFISQSNAHK